MCKLTHRVIPLDAALAKGVSILVDWTIALYVGLAAYAAGSIPTAYLVGYAVKRVDIRTIGSGNVGASNARRLLGTKWAIAVLFFDALKGFFPVFLVLTYFLVGNPQVYRYAMLAALSCIVGHVFPVWLKFRGGKGVATGLGVMAALVPLCVAVVVPVFVLVVALSKFISLGSICAALALPAAFFIRYSLPQDTELFVFICTACVFVIYKHKSNIKRILAGTENRLGAKKEEQNVHPKLKE